LTAASKQVLRRPGEGLPNFSLYFSGNDGTTKGSLQFSPAEAAPGSKEHSSDSTNLLENLPVFIAFLHIHVRGGKNAHIGFDQVPPA